MPRGTGSVWTMLVWKEWRQQRLAALLLGLFCLLGYAGYSGFYRWEPEPGGLVVLLALVALCLGTSVFAGETDDQTALFLDALPLPAWQTLTGKYLMAGGLTVLCLGPTLLFYGALALADERVCPPRFLYGAPEALMLTTATIALTGALARQGLRGMGTLLASAALGASALVMLQWVGHLGWQVCRVSVPEQTLFLALWVVAHVWLLCAWLWRRRSQPTWRSAVIWAALFLLVPLGPATALLAYQETYQQVWMPFDLWSKSSWAQAAVSPDGRTVALWTWRRTSISGRASALWLLDVAGGQIRRVGSPWQRYRLSLPYSSQMTWSPDSKQFHVYENPASSPGQAPPLETGKAIKQWTIQAGSGAIEETSRGTESPRASCLADGTKAVHTPTAWEFTDGTTGEVRRCLHPSTEDSVDRQFGKARRFRQEHALLSVGLDLDANGGATCHVWESSPELTEARRRDISLRSVFPPGPLRPVQVSPDGSWLCFTILTRAQEERPFWVASLADGTCQRIATVGKEPASEPLFTPDSGLLLVPRPDCLDILELASGRWRVPIPFSVPSRAGFRPRLQPFADNPHLLAVCGPNAVSVLNLEQGTSTPVFALPDRQRGPTQEVVVLWLGQDRLLIERRCPYELWTVNADGTNRRQVLP